MPVNKNIRSHHNGIVRHVRIEGGQVEKRIVAIPNRFQQREATALLSGKAEQPKQPDPVVPEKKSKKTPVVAPIVQDTNNVTVSIPSGYSGGKETIPVCDVETKAERAKVLKAINEALLGKPKKVGQRGGFLRKLQ